MRSKMDKLLRKTFMFSETVQRINEQGQLNYLIISDFGTSSVTTSEGFHKPYFRIFNPVNDKKGRKLNSSDFNVYKDSLMDYPTIAAYKLGKDSDPEAWRQYNRLISVHIARCPINCWHCYLEECLRDNCIDCSNSRNCNKQRKTEINIKADYMPASKILNDFLQQREIDNEKGIYTNILRITGGEPFLAPNLILELLEELKRRNLQNEIILWTETNLIPLCSNSKGETIVSTELLNNLGQYNNLCVHPCLHGLNKKEFYQITGSRIDDYGQLINALQRLISSGIDIYPTFGSNTSSPCNIDCFYNEISKINPMLPLRFCMIEYDLNYLPVLWRHKHIKNFASKFEKVFDRYQIIDKWDKLLQKDFGHKYAEIPRHKINLTHFKIKDNMLHLFKWPSSPTYQRFILQLIALPRGAAGTLRYGSKWVHNSFENNVASINRDQINALFWVISKSKQADNSFSLDFVYPLRYLEIVQIRLDQDVYEIDYIAKDFISYSSKITDLAELIKLTNINFGINNIPSPGNNNGFVFLGPEMKEIFTTSMQPSLEKLNTDFKDIPTLEKVTPPLYHYPMISIRSIENTTFDKNGNINIGASDKYKINFSVFQSNDFVKSDRQIYINDEMFYGKFKSDCVLYIKNIKEIEDEYKLQVLCNTLFYPVPIRIKKKYNFFRKWLPELVSMGIIAGGFLLSFRLISSATSDQNKLNITLIGTFITLLLKTCSDIISKKRIL